MPDDRRYRQTGYRESGRAPAPPPRPQGPGARPRQADGPRSFTVPGSRSISRCAGCGARLLPLPAEDATCPACGAALRVCRQCAHFEPGRRFECAQPIAARIADKAARNDCPHFSLRVSVERDVSPPGVTRPEDARRAFDNLFKR